MNLDLSFNGERNPSQPPNRKEDYLVDFIKDELILFHLNLCTFKILLATSNCLSILTNKLPYKIFAYFKTKK
ncbi:MAG: hypothetical protein PHN69_05660 [Candidatus Pacebacteria bacterium]|nr:hypothetical protein [Candidatus Paceibacterota bacterium]